MAAVPPSGVSGVAKQSGPYPQYGIQGIGSTSIVTANSESQRVAYTAQGYDLWFTSKADAQKQISSQNGPLNGEVPGANWLTGLGGMIASGLESAFVAGLTDLWNVILGPIEIYLGFSLAFLIVLWLFKDDLMALAPLAMALAG